MNTNAMVLILGTLLASLAIGCKATSTNWRVSPHPATAVTGQWSIVIHGGAGMLDKAMPAEQRAAYEAALRTSLDAGKAILARGGTSLDACEAAVRVLEDHPLFNAGRGAVLTREGIAELDASIMDGQTLKAGAIAGVKTVKNPITLARRVMTETPHILIAREHADALAAKWNIDRAEPGYFVTPRRREALEKKMKDLGLPPPPPSPGLPRSEADAPTGASTPTITPTWGDTTGTVGCVALDTHGNLAAATSTGGLNAKMPGRVGDTPIIGAGTYANNASVAVSCTGTGEQFIRHVAAHELAALMLYAGASLKEAADTVLNHRLDHDDGGLIAIDRKGNVIATMTTGCMPRAWATSNGAQGAAIWE